MDWKVELFLYAFLLFSAIVALEVRDLLAASITTAAFSFMIAIHFVAMGAVDVGFTEAVVGAGILGVYFVAFVLRTKRSTQD